MAKSRRHGRDRTQNTSGESRPRCVAWKAGTSLLGPRGQPQEGRNKDMSDPWRWEPRRIYLRGRTLPTNPLCVSAKGLPKFRSMVEAREGNGVG